MWYHQNVARSERARSMKVKALFFMSCLLVCMGLPDAVGAADVQTKSFPIPLRIDFGQCLKTSLYVKCKFVEYNRSYPQFVTQETGNPERAFKEVISAIRGKNPALCLDLCSRIAGLTEGKRQLYTKNIDLLINNFSNTILSNERIGESRIDLQYCFGNTRLFVWGRDDPSEKSKAFRTWTIFSRNQADELLWVPQVSRLDDFSMLLMNIAYQRAESEGGFKAIEKQGFRYELAVPGTAEGDAAYLQFNGKVYDCNIFEDSVDPNDKVMRFYQGAYEVLRDKSIEDFVQFYTTKSRQNFMRRLTDPMSRNYAPKYHEDMIESGLKVLFVLDAKPFYFVFFRKINSRDKAIRFTDVVLDPLDNKLRFTNFNYTDYLHTFLKNKELFVNPILKPLIEHKLK